MKIVAYSWATYSGKRTCDIKTQKNNESCSICLLIWKISNKRKLRVKYGGTPKFILILYEKKKNSKSLIMY